MPARREHFEKLRQVLGLAMTERSFWVALKRSTFSVCDIAEAGRDLVRMMRAARTGRLDPGSLRRVERLFGVGVRDLIEATRLAVVDDVQVEV